MKKTKPLSLHQIQTNSPSTTKKKSPLTIKQKPTKAPLSKKSTQTFKQPQQPQDYIIINDNIYSANTFTERNCYDQFLTKVKKEKQQQRKSFLFKQTLDQSQSAKLKKGKESTKKKFKKLAPEDLIKCMSLDEKREMFYKLQQEIKSTNAANVLPVDLPSLSQNNKQSQPCSTESFENDLSQRMRLDSERQRQEKFQMLEQKLQTLKMQLLFKWESQLERLQDLYRKGRIGQKEKDNKCVLIQKLKDHKLKIIECTKTLFQKILQQDTNNGQQRQQVERKNDKIEAILQSLHSLPSLESLKDQQIDRQPNIDHLKVSEKAKQTKTDQNIHNNNQPGGLKQRQNVNEQQQTFLFNKKSQPITTIDSSPLQIVQDSGHGVFLSEFNQDIQNKKIKIRQQLVSPLGFMNNSPNKQPFSSFSKQRFGQFQQINTIVNTGYNNIPTRSEQILKELLQLGDAPKDDDKKFKNNFNQQHSKNQSNKMSLKLDLRLDQIVFGQDEYPQCEKNQHSKTHVDSKFNDFNHNSIDQYIKPNISNFDNLQRLNLKIEERVIRDIHSKSSKKRSLIQFTQQKIQPTSQEQIKQEIQAIQQKKPIIVQKISFAQLQTKELKSNNDKNAIKQQKVSLVELSQYKKPQLVQIPKQEFKIPLNLEFNQQEKQNKQTSPLGIEQQQKQQQKPTIINQSIHPTQQQTQSSQQDQSLDQLECHQVTHTAKPTIDIPMILSQQKMETLALQQNRLFRENIDKRIAFQMGCIQLQPQQSSSPHFTTLVDVNSYIVGLYQFMMKKYMSSLVDSLNIPYGKSAVDKLYSLHTQGFVLEESYNQMNNILSESHFKEYQRQMALTVRRCSQHQTAHNRAVFEAFTKAINVYRPYYELEGQVFPWIVSQKGITFYEITEDNIEEVFQKSKIKVLEYCTSLCGIHSPSQVKNDEQLAIVNNKNQQNLNKIIKAETLQQFQEWKIRFVNFDCLVKILLGKALFAEIINQVTQEIQSISNKRKILTE